MNNSYLWIPIVVGLAAVGVASDSLLKISTESSGKSMVALFIISMAIYGATAFGWFFVIKHVKLATVGAYYAVSTILFLALVGVFGFKEQINITEKVGIILAVASVILLARFA